MSEASEAAYDEPPAAGRRCHDAEAGLEQLLEADLARRSLASTTAVGNLHVDAPRLQQLAPLVREG